MTNTNIDYRAVWESYASIWKLEGAKAKRAACAGPLSPSCVYADPLARLSGWSACPDGLVSTEVPASRYAVFTHKGPAQNVDRTVDYIYSSWLAQSDFRHTYGPDLEIYDERWHPTADSSVMMYAIPVA